MFLLFSTCSARLLAHYVRDLWRRRTYTLRDKPGLKEEAAEWFWSVWTQGIHVKSQRIYDMTNTYKKKGISEMRFPGVLLRGI